MLDRFPNIRELTPLDKLTLLSEIWDDVAKTPDDIPVSEEELDELDRRMEEFHKDPSKVTTWDEIKGRLLKSGHE